MEVKSDGDGDMDDVHMVPDSVADSQGRKEPASKRVAQSAGIARDNSVEMGDDVAGTVPQISTRSPLAEMTPANATTRQDKELPSLQEQIARIETLVRDMVLSEGAKGYVISSEWLEEVQNGGSKTSGRQGPVDNTALVEDLETDLKDEEGEPFLALKPGLSLSLGIELLPKEAWEQILRWYGAVQGSPTIVRYCHNTSSAHGSENMQFELYPPIFTILKLQDPSGQPTLVEKTSRPIKTVSTRTQLFQKFLKDAKEACRIPVTTKVRVWRLIGQSASQSQSQAGMMTPVHSRENSPAGDITSALLLDMDKFVALQYGAEREELDAQDETGNEKYNGSSTVDLVGLGQAGVIVLEPQIGGPAGGEWPSAVFAQSSKKGLLSANGNGGKKSNAGSRRTSPAPQGMMTRGRAGKNGRTRGTIGLGNLGNTCYMNSALQCVRSVKELTEYFLEDKYKPELNPSNPLAHKGDVAKAYAGLLKEIYNSGSNHSFAPRNFKSIIGRYGPSFSGYGQQDSQEFLLFLLDGLQEDLNRIHKKPYIEKPDSTDEMVHDEKKLAEFADTCWDIYKARNDSVITDLFAGMYKSTVKCPVCSKVSIIFDPFNNLTLQLPVENIWSRRMSFYPLNLRPVSIQAEIEKNSSISQLLDYVGKKVSVDPKRLVVAEIYQNKYYKFFDPSIILGEERIQANDDIVIIEVDQVPTNYPSPKKKGYRSFSLAADPEDDTTDEDGSRSDRLLVPVFHRASKDAVGSRTSIHKPLFGEPTLIVVNKDEAKDLNAILKKCLARVATMTTRDILEEGSENSQDEDSDMVVMGNDTDSSSDSRVQASSVQGEEGMVDISMKDADDVNDGPQRSYPPPPRISKPLPKMLQADGQLAPGLLQLFEMKYFKSPQESVPTAWNTFSDSSKKLPSLQSRLPKQSRPRPAGEQLKRALVDGEFSDDEIDSPPPAKAESQRRILDSDSDSDTDGLPEVQQLRAPNNEGDSGKADASDTDSGETQTRGDDPLIRFGEGIVLDWSDEGYDALFGGYNEEESRGTPTWKSERPTLPDPEQDRKSLLRRRRQKDGISLDDCLDEFGKEEILSENDAWYCPKCKEHRRASKKFELWKVPDVLVIHLKRFSASRGLRDKLDLFVDFPTEGLDLGSRVATTEGRELTYDLFAVDNHYGGLGGGHYTAFAQNFYDESWYEYNDSMASKRNDPKDAVTPAAYLLFYRRRSDQHLGGEFFDKLYQEIDNPEEGSDSQPQSRTESPSSQAGEGRRLGDSSRINGLSSAYQGAGVVHQAGGGGPEVKETEALRTSLDHELSTYTEFESNDTPMTSTEQDDANPIILGSLPTWRFSNLDEFDNASIGSNSSTAVNKDDMDDSSVRSGGSYSPDYPTVGKPGTPEVTDILASSGPQDLDEDNQPVANITVDEEDTHAVVPGLT